MAIDSHIIKKESIMLSFFYEYYNKLISACQGVSIRPCKYV